MERLGTWESPQRLPFARREHALADSIEVGQESEALGAHAAPIEGRYQLRFAASAAGEVNHAWLLPAETLPEDRPQDRSALHEANRVTVAPEALRPAPLVVA
jgi:hypothetical protein